MNKIYFLVNIFLLAIFIFPVNAFAADPLITAKGFDVIIIAGQSNNLAGLIKDQTLDIGAPNVYQLGRGGTDDLKVILAAEPLHHLSRTGVDLSNRIGYGLRMARILKSKDYATSDRPLLIIAQARGSTGFSGTDKCWSTGNLCRTDLVNRVNFVMNMPGKTNRIIGMFWLQGENDAISGVTQVQYEKYWLEMLKEYEDKIQGFNANTPVFIGQMVPSWIRSYGAAAQTINRAHKNLPNLRTHTYFVSAELPTELGLNDEAAVGKPDNLIHYSSVSQRALANRFAQSFLLNSGMEPVNPSTPSPNDVLGDLNHDGNVDNTDYQTYFKPNFGRSGTPGFVSADINRNGKVDIFDYTILVANFQR